MFLFHFTQKFFEYNHKTDFIKQVNHRYIKLIEKVPNKIIREKTIKESHNKKWMEMGRTCSQNE